MATARELGPAGWKSYRGPELPVPLGSTGGTGLSLDAQRRLTRVRQAAEELKGLGARRVILFGSFARGDWSMASDVDLAVLGLPAHLFWKAGCMAENTIADRPVDLVALEQASEALRRSIESDGVEL